MSRNPFLDSREQDERLRSFLHTERAVVVSTANNTDGNQNQHTIGVRTETANAAESAKVLIGQRGDVQLPTVGDRVLCVRQTEGKLLVVGSIYSVDDDVPNYEAGERIVSHPPTNSRVHLRNDGSLALTGDAGTSIEIQADGTVVIDGGTNGAVTGLTTTTDADGHVTDITLERNNNILI